MNQEELENFYQLDKKEYLVSNNQKLNILMQKLGISFSEQEIQSFIYKLISWYEVKFSDDYIESIFHHQKKVDTVTVADLMDFSQLYQRFTTSELEFFVKNNKEEAEFFHQLIQMVGFGLIYSRRSNPDYGYFRASQFISDFQTYCNYPYDMEIYDMIMERNYSSSDENFQKLLEFKKRQEHSISKTKQKKKKKGWKRLFRR